MKTTVKTTTGSVDIQPLPSAKCVLMSLWNLTGNSETLFLTPEQAGALIFGIEQAVSGLEKPVRAAT